MHGSQAVSDEGGDMIAGGAQIAGIFRFGEEDERGIGRLGGEAPKHDGDLARDSSGGEEIEIIREGIDVGEDGAIGRRGSGAKGALLQMHDIGKDGRFAKDGFESVEGLGEADDGAMQIRLRFDARKAVLQA